VRERGGGSEGVPMYSQAHRQFDVNNLGASKRKSVLCERNKISF
jgi:hypothetical protein